MKDKKDTVEINVNEEMTEELAKETAYNAEVEEAVNEKTEVREEVKAEPVYYQPAKTKTKKTVSWGNKGVTRKFLIASLVLTLLLNAALTVGMSALFGRHGLKNKSGFSDNNQGSRPNFEQFDDDDWNYGGGRGYNGGGRMMPPGSPYDNNWNGNQNNNQNNNQNAAPDSNQNAAPDTNQNNTQNNTQNSTQNDAQTQGTSFEI